MGRVVSAAVESNIMKININEIKKNYPSLKMWDDNLAFEIYKKIQKHQLITEFLYTIDPVKTATQFPKQLGHDVGYINYGKKDGFIVKILFTFANYLRDDIDKVNKYFDKFGWYPSYLEPGKTNGGKYSDKLKAFENFKNITVIYEAKYDMEVNPSKYIYHLTPDLKWPKIKTFGLTPKTQSKLSNHPGRIYLLNKIDNLGDYGGDVWDIAFNLLDSYKFKDIVKEMYLLKIDVSKLKDMHFFDDPNFYMGEAVWTYQNIPPYAISIEDKINVEH